MAIATYQVVIQRLPGTVARFLLRSTPARGCSPEEKSKWKRANGKGVRPVDAATGGPAARRGISCLWFRSLVFGLSGVLFQEFANERMIKLVSPASGASQQPSFRQSAEIHAVARRKLFCCDLFIFFVSQDTEELKLAFGDLREVRTKFLPFQSREDRRPLLKGVLLCQ